MKYIIESNDVIGYTPKYAMLFGDGYMIQPLEDLEELNSDYINEHFGWLQDDAYQRGLDEAWEAARKISLMSPDEIEKVFPGAAKYNRYNLGYSGVEVIAKLKAYEDKQKEDDRIEVGDEVIWKTENITLIVTSTYEASGLDWCDGVAQDGKVYRTLIENDRKTGKHYDIASILEAMRA